MGQHAHNETAIKAKQREIAPKVKAEKPPSKREKSFLERWTAVIMAGRPAPKPVKEQQARRQRKRLDRENDQIRRLNARTALQTLRERQKSARKAKAA